MKYQTKSKLKNVQLDKACVLNQFTTTTNEKKKEKKNSKKHTNKMRIPGYNSPDCVPNTRSAVPDASFCLYSYCCKGCFGLLDSSMLTIM